MDSIKIFHYCGSLNFASRALFKSELCSLIRINLANEIKRNQSPSSLQQHYESISMKCLVIDFSALSYIDPSGVSALKLLIADFNKLCINVYIAGASCKFDSTFSIVMSSATECSKDSEVTYLKIC